MAEKELSVKEKEQFKARKAFQAALRNLKPDFFAKILRKIEGEK